MDFLAVFFALFLPALFFGADFLAAFAFFETADFLVFFLAFAALTGALFLGGFLNRPTTPRLNAPAT